MTLALLSRLDEFGIYASLGEVAFISLGTVVFVLGQMRARRERVPYVSPVAGRFAS